METSLSENTLSPTGMFKSYYVVWKPYEVTTANDGRFQFKSYYVVWKLLSSFSPIFEYPEFKSYYVVWKHNNIIVT